MSTGEHSHWVDYYTRVIPAQNLISNSGNLIEPEKLQHICHFDGIIFHEVEIKKE